MSISTVKLTTTVKVHLPKNVVHKIQQLLVELIVFFQQALHGTHHITAASQRKISFVAANVQVARSTPAKYSHVHCSVQNRLPLCMKDEHSKKIGQIWADHLVGRVVQEVFNGKSVLFGEDEIS